MKDWLDWRPPRGGVAFLAVLYALAGAFFLYTGGDSWYTRYFCPLMLPMGVGLWLKHQWARWTAFSFFLFLATLLAIVLFIQGFSWQWLLKVAVVASSLYCLWDWEVYPEGQPDSD